MDVFTLAAKLTLETGEFSAELAQAESEAKGFGSSKVWKTIGKAAAGAVVVAGAGVAKAIKSSVETGMQFDAMMSEVQAVSGATGHEFDILRARAQELGATTKFTATEAAEAFYYMGLAGWDVEEMLDGIGPVLSLAAASGEDLGRTSDIVTDALTALGYKAKDAAEFADVLAAAATNSNTTVGMMGEAFKYLATTGGVLGYSMEDVAVTLGLLANNGIKAGQAGTSMRQILNTLINPTDKAAEAMDALGISLFEEGTDKRIPLLEVLQNIREVFKDSGFNLEGFSPEELDKQVSALNEWYDAAKKAAEENGKFVDQFGAVWTSAEIDERYKENLESLTHLNESFLGKLGDIGGLRGISSLFAIMNSTDEDFNQLVSSVYDSEGKAQEMAETMLDNLKGDITILNSAIDGLKLAVSDEFKQPFRDFVQMLTGGISEITQSIRENGLENGLLSLIFGDRSVEDKVYDAQVEAEQTLYSVERTEESAIALINRLSEMGDPAAMTAVEMEVWKRLAADLITLIPSLAGQIDLETASIKSSTEELKANTKAWAEQAKQQAYRNAYVTQQEALANAANQAFNAEVEALKAEKEKVSYEEKAIALVNEGISKYRELFASYGISEFDIGDYSLEDLQKAANILGNLGEDDSTEIGMAVSSITALEEKAENARSKAEELKDQLKAAQDEFDAYAEAVSVVMDSATLSATDAESKINDVNNAIDAIPSSKTVTINVQTIGDDFIPHAKGAASIPYDNYPALLHRGEMVLTASQARRYRDGQGGFSLASITSAVAEAVRAGLEQAQFDFELDGDVLTRGVIRRQTNDAMARRFVTV